MRGKFRASLKKISAGFGEVTFSLQLGPMITKKEKNKEIGQNFENPKCIFYENFEKKIQERFKNIKLRFVGVVI